MPDYILENGWTLVTKGATGRPILCHEGRTYQPSDHEGGPAHRVAAWAYVLLRTCPQEAIRGEIEAARAYLMQWPGGPQLDVAEIGDEAIIAPSRVKERDR